MSTEEKQVQSVDEALGEYILDNERVVDFFNAALYNGEKRLTGADLEDLSEVLTSTVTDSDSIRGAADLVRGSFLWDTEPAWLLLLCTEDPSDAITYYALEYMTLLYRRQIEHLMRAHAGEDMSETSGYPSFGKTSKPKPVSVVVLYTGAQSWDTALEFEDTLAPEGLHDGVLKFKVPIVDAAKNTLPLGNQDNINLRTMLELALDGIDAIDVANRLSTFIDTHQPDRDVVKVVAAITNDPVLLEKEDAMIEASDNKEVGGVTAYGQQMLEQGRNEGREIIIDMGLDNGLDDAVIVNFLQRTSISPDEARSRLDRRKEQRGTT